MTFNQLTNALKYFLFLSCLDEIFDYKMESLAKYLNLIAGNPKHIKLSFIFQKRLLKTKNKISN
jgi:hypothetical protein